MKPLELLTEPLLAQGGDAVARAPDGRVVFVSGAAPSERVRAKIVQENKTFLRAEVRAVLEPGPARVEPRCPHFGDCGGCTSQHVSAEAQLSSKQAAFVATLSKIARIDPAQVQLEAPWSGEPFGYRSRARFAVTAGRLGYRARGARRAIAINTGPVLSPALEAAAIAYDPAPGQTEVELLEASGRVLTEDDPPVLVPDGGSGAGSFGPLYVSAAVFQQQNPAGNQALLETIAAWIKDRPEFGGAVLELFAGSGNITRVLARRAARVVAVEGEGAAVSLLSRLKLERTEVRVADAASATFEDERYDASLVDPPRTGLAPPLIEALAARGGASLLYVSCDPATFARDLGRFSALGYALERARLFDFYPQTPHAEVLGLLRRG